MQIGKILIVDDNKRALAALQLLLQTEFEQVMTLSGPNQIVEMLGKIDFDLVLLDMNFTTGVNTGNEGLFWLGEIKRINPTIEVVMITAYGDVELAVKALKKGAADFILKPWENEKLLATLRSVLKLRRSNMQVEELKQREQVLKSVLYKEHLPIVGTSPGMMQMMHMITKVAKTSANVLITGENGTGKELVAREIHARSDRNHELLVTVDMGAVAETLFESELFGHKKGAFTDAREDRIGKFQLAHHGTLFLDEIGNLPMSLQTKLLSTIQNHTVVPLGSNQPVHIDIRLICATNCDLDALVADQKFREDLLYRINTICIEVPPLRERGRDIEALSQFFLQRFQQKYRKNRLKITTQAVHKLMKYSWPGNVRELQHVIEKAVILNDSGVLQADDFVFRPAGSLTASSLQTFEEMEKKMIETALDKYHGKHTTVAKQLGISRQTLYNKMKRYDI